MILGYHNVCIASVVAKSLALINKDSTHHNNTSEVFTLTFKFFQNIRANLNFEGRLVWDSATPVWQAI